MALCTAAEVREAGMFPAGSAGKLDNPLTSIYIPAASQRLKKWVGEEAYADAESETPEDEERAEALKRAEIFLALEAIFRGALNTRHDTGGMLQSLAGAMGGSTTFMRPDQLNEIADRYLAMAERAADDYNSLDTDTSPRKSPAYYDDGTELE